MTSKMLEMWPMFALFKYDMLSRRGKGLVLRPLLDKLCITLSLCICLCVGRLYHMAVVRRALLRVFLYTV